MKRIFPLALLLLIASAAIADEVELYDGSKIKGMIERQDTKSIKIKTIAGSITLMKTGIKNISFGESAGGGGNKSGAAVSEKSTGNVSVDAKNSLMWQKRPSENYFDWKQAYWYCDGLRLEGHDDWRMPDIAELRTLVKGCPGSESNGGCPVGPKSSSDMDRDSCSGCDYREGNGYFNDIVTTPAGYYWSSSIASKDEGIGDPRQTEHTDSFWAWVINAEYSQITYYAGHEETYVLCVRDSK